MSNNSNAMFSLSPPAGSGTAGGFAAPFAIKGANGNNYYSANPVTDEVQIQTAAGSTAGKIEFLQNGPGHFINIVDDVLFMQDFSLLQVFKFNLDLGNGTANTTKMQMAAGGATADVLTYHTTNGTTLNGGTGTGTLVITPTGSAVLTPGSGGSLNLNNSTAMYKINGTQVVAARNTGWTPWTGASSKASFDPSTVTLVQVAQALKALLDAQTTHGLIGA